MMRSNDDLARFGKLPAATPSSPLRRTATPLQIDFARLVGSAGWARLPAAVRRRFSHAPRGDAAITYAGVMHVVDCSAVGFLLAQLLRLIGTPFAPWRGADVPVMIALKADPASGGTAWERLYHYPERPPLLVRSVKQLAHDGGLLECVQGGFGMRLAVAERRHTLTFRSIRYFWRFSGCEVTLPALLTPGTAHVIHADLGDGRFRFRLTVRHKLLGMTFRQDGVFAERGDGDEP